MIWNSKYATDPIVFVQDDVVDLTINIQKKNQTTGIWEDYDMTGKSLRLKIVNKHRTTIVDWSTTAGELVIILSRVQISASAINSISCCGSFDGQLIEITPQLTLWKGIVKIEASII